MEQKKYELTSETTTLLNGTVLHRIRALRDFGDVKAGDLGGFIEKESNLSHDGDAWVSGDARVESDNDICVFGYFGSENRFTTAFRTQGGEIGVKCGCFYGTLAEFRKKVKKTHGDNDYAVEYLMIADLIEHKLARRKGN